MKSLIATAVLLCSPLNAALEEDSSLMQGLLARHNLLSVVDADTKETRKDATAKLMETATKMMKNGVTPDVVTFIETTITEVNQNVLGVIVQEHDRDQAFINQYLADIQTAITVMEACASEITQQHTDRTTASETHRECRSEEALDCARSRKCEAELEHLWAEVKVQEEEMRRIHGEIFDEWCVGPVPPHPGLADPFDWPPTTSKEGPETSETTQLYPSVDLPADVITFRSFSVQYFGLYMARKPLVEAAWLAYNTKLIECAELEQTLDDKVAVCDVYQDSVHSQACTHATNNRQCRQTFGQQYEIAKDAYDAAVIRIAQLEFDRKREWETLHIVTCLLETVYTHVIHAIDSGEPCPTEESHPDQTADEIQWCHVINASMTANLTIDYGTPPVPPALPPMVAPPCTAQYIWDEHGMFPTSIHATYSQTLVNEGLENYFTALSTAGWAGCAAPKACIDCSNNPDPITVAGYTDSQKCKKHQEYLAFGEMDSDSFKCVAQRSVQRHQLQYDVDGRPQNVTVTVMEDECILASGRCNGATQCSDGSDELNCDTTWGSPALLHTETCQNPFSADVQFQCGDGTCIPKEAKCNGYMNCPGNEDEAGCVSTTTGVTLEATTGLTATLETPAIGSAVFYDRQYTFDSLGDLTGYRFIKMSNDDKWTRHSHVQMKLRLPQPTSIYVVKLDTTALDWLDTDGWAVSSLTGVSYHGIRQTRHTDWSGTLTEDFYTATQVYEKTFPAGTVEMRGNNGGDGSYLIFVANPAHQPVSPIVLWSQHLPGGNTGRVKCNNNVNMQYVADQAACQQLAISNGHPFYSFRHNGENSGHKCMSSATCDSPLLDRSNQWYIYSSSYDGPETQCSSNPSAPGGVGRYEAEDATLNGGQVDSNHAGFTGTGFFNYLANTNDYIEWSLPSCSGGQATLQFRYALASGDRPLQVLLNGVEVTSSLSTPATGSWTQYSRASLAVTLVAGTNTVRLVAAGQSGANVDSLLVLSGTPSYYVDAYGNSDCPVGHRIMTEADCRTAHTQLNLEVGGSDDWVGTNNGIPSGCSTREANQMGQHHFHWDGKTIGTGVARADLAPICVLSTVAWTTAVSLTGSGDTVETDIGQTAFNTLFDACPVVKYTRNGAVNSVYVRRSGSEWVDGYSLFTYEWSSTNNERGEDFDIYSSETNAWSSTSAWSFCNYNDPDVGYPRDCGPSGSIANTWFSMPESGQHDASSGGGPQRFNARGLSSGASFEIYTGPNCPSN